MQDVTYRHVARVLLMDENARVLLFDTQLSYTRVWMPPGGRLEDGESYEEAALRELREETGLSGVALGPHLWTTRFRFRHQGQLYEQDELYLAARVQAFDLSTEDWQPEERGEIQSWRWWSRAEVMASQEQFRPGSLALLLEPVLSGYFPEFPLAVPIEAGAVQEPL